MKKFFIAILSVFLTACVFDSVTMMGIKNNTNDTILICSTRYNNIDSVKHCIRFGSNPIEFDDMKKIIIQKANILTLPDSIGYYHERGNKNSIFRYNADIKGYFFIVKLETVQNYTWDEIRKYKLYDELIVTREMLIKNDRIIDYY